MDDLKELFWKDGIRKKMNIKYDSGEITNKELHSEQFELIERICSAEVLRFGTCEASEIKFRISNVVTPLVDKELTVKETLDGNANVSFQFGKYKVHSDNFTANRRYRDIVAYDSMYDILSAEVSGWYNTILPDSDSSVTLKQFRSSLLEHLGVEQEDVTLVNDSMIVRKTIEPSQLSGKTVITAICEINGCFGHIGRDGRFKYVILKPMTKGLVPSATLHPRKGLHPSTTGKSEEIDRKYYISAQYEDFVTERINKLQLRQEENDIGCVYGVGDNCYIVQDNFLLYGMSADELYTVAANMYRVISKVSYRPAHVEAKGNPCLEVGDGIKLATNTVEIDTYILQRTLKGIQALRDTYDAEGTQKQKEKVNGTNEQIIQLKGKINRLTRTVDETRSYIEDTEKKLSSEIIKKANEIALRVRKDNVIAEINVSPESILLSANKIDLVGIVNADTFISNLVNAEKLVTKFATIETLNAVNAEITGELIAQAARLQSLEADHVSVVQLNAVNAAVSGKLDASQLSAAIGAMSGLNAQSITCNSYMVSYGGRQPVLTPMQATINGQTYVILGATYTG